jgi:hypothetical protein
MNRHGRGGRKPDADGSRAGVSPRSRHGIGVRGANQVLTIANTGLQWSVERLLDPI